MVKKGQKFVYVVIECPNILMTTGSGATPGPTTISSLIGTSQVGTPNFDTSDVEAPQIQEPPKVETIADIVTSRW